jgi:hypothetical protein
MRVAKVISADSTPLKIDGVLKKGGRQLQISNYDTVHDAKGKLVGYTTLRKTTKLDVDRLRIGDSYFDLHDMMRVNPESIKFCICVNDYENQWVCVLPKFTQMDDAPVITDFKSSKKESHFSYKHVLVPIIIGCSIFVVSYSVLSHKQEVKQVVKTITEPKTNTVTQPGTEKTYVYGAKVDSDTQTAEAAYEKEIQHDKKYYANDNETISSVQPDDSYVSITSKISSTESDDQTSKPKDDRGTFYSTEDTILTPAASTSFDTDNPTDWNVSEYSPVISNITISEKNTGITLMNPTSDKCNVSLLTKSNKEIVSCSIDSGASTTLELLSHFSKTTKVTIKYEFFDSEDKLCNTLSSKITVYVL